MSDKYHLHAGCTCYGNNTIKKAIRNYLKYKEEIYIMKVPTTEKDAPNHPCYVGIRPHGVAYWRDKNGYKTVAKIEYKSRVTII